jgi:hypothetical protein
MEDKKYINEEGEGGGAVGTTTASVLGDPGSPTYGGYIGPLGRISRKKLNSRLFNTWKDGSVKNSAGVGKLVTSAPQGYVKEHVYSIEGKMVTEADLNDWFGADLKQKPSWNGGKLVTIEPKCLAFPYCSQGAIDKPIKLIGETKEGMCPNCYEYCSHVANETKKTPEAIAKIIRERYLREMIQLDESIELKNKKQNINEMNNLSNLSVSEMRSAMHKMMTEKSDCLYEVLVQEGFLSEELNEGGTYENQCSTMMEDDDIMCEMYKACATNESECGSNMQSYLSEKLIGGQKELDKNHDGKISGADFEMMRKDEVVENAEEGGSRYMFFSNLELIKHHVEEMMAMDPSKIESILENGHDWAADHMATAKESIDQVFDFLTGEAEEGTGEVTTPFSSDGNQPEIVAIDMPVTESEDEDEDDDQESPTYLLKMKKVLDDKISKYSKYVSKFIPMVAKLDASTMNQYYNTELQGIEYSNEGFMDFLTKKEDESSIEYYSRLTKLGAGYPDVFSGLVEPRKRGYFAKFGDSIGFETLDVMEDVLSDIFDMKNSIYTTKSKIDSIEMGIEDRNANKELDTTNDDDEVGTKFSPEKVSKIDAIVTADELGLYDDEDERLEEGNLPTFKPVVGKNTTSTNKTESNKENKEATIDAEKSQDSVEQKVDNLKNQKHNPNDFEKDVDAKSHGWRNNLDLDYKTELDKEQKDRILDQADGNAPEDHANVVKSDAGKKLKDAAKERSKDSAINANDYTSSHDRTTVEKNQGYVKTTVFNEEASKDIERMKAMFGYEKKIVEENKLTKALNETEILYKQISNKKFI